MSTQNQAKEMHAARKQARARASALVVVCRAPSADADADAAAAALLSYKNVSENAEWGKEVTRG